MGKVEEGFAKGKSIFAGIDVHRKDWTVHVICQGEELYHSTIAPEPERLIAALKRFEASEVHTVYGVHGQQGSVLICIEDFK